MVSKENEDGAVITAWEAILTSNHRDGAGFRNSHWYWVMARTQPRPSAPLLIGASTRRVRARAARTFHSVSAADPCPFCTTVLSDPSCWMYANEHAVAFFDRYPSAPGHMLVIPRVHVSHVLDLARAEVDAVFDLALRCRAACTAPAATIGINDGPAAGQTVPHMHLHVIPRTLGDHPDPRGGVRWVLPETAAYFTK